jgi:hypothetical protein
MTPNTGIQVVRVGAKVNSRSLKREIALGVSALQVDIAGHRFVIHRDDYVVTAYPLPLQVYNPA